MKFIFLIVVISLGFHCTKAQYPEFAPVGATWYYNEFQLNGDLITRKIVSINDTVRFNKSCKFLSSESSGKFFAFRDSLKMYTSAIADTQWYQLYDFNTEVGDTFYARVWAAWMDSIPVKVIDKGTTTIGGFDLPFILIESLDLTWPWNGKAILNIGSDVYFVPPYPIADPITEGLRCYEDVIIGNYHLESTCDTSYSVGLSNILHPTSIVVSPNPFHDYILISSRAEIMANCAIYDLLGNTVLNVNNVTPQDNFPINTTMLKPGNYILRVGQLESSHYFKLIKQ